ncbi:V-type ATP synthase subunit I [Sulfurisphaera javensis]|uniref:A-type ATP synthase subunit I n=2 Tax=Sulfurisphaera javensis TaxID=2049879 RepID=A0AAT9GV05_9CREN
MARVEILSPKQKINELITKILLFKEFEPEEPRMPISNIRFEDARRNLGEVNEHINKLKILMELGGLIIEPQGKMKINDWFDASNLVFEESSTIENKYKDLLEEIGKLRGELDTLNSQIKEVEPFKDIGIDLKILYSSSTFEVALAILDSNQKKEIENKEILVVSEPLENNKYACLLIGKKNSKLDELMKELGIRKFETPDLIAPQIYYNNLKQRIDEILVILTQKREELSKKIKEDEKNIKEIYGKLLTIRDAMNILSKARSSDYYVQVEGYVPEKSLKKLSKSLDNIAFLTYEYPKRYGEEEEPPTYVKLPKSIAPLESVIEFYGTPSYWEISPTVFLIITFPFLFGLMFPDFGNALILLLFSIWFYNYGKKRGSENTIKLSLVLVYSSIVAMVTGLLAREFFGPLPVGGLRELLNNPSAPVGPLYYIWPIPESVYQQISDIIPTGANAIINTILLSLLLGSVLLFVSTLLGVINAIKKKDKEYLLLDRLPLFIIYIVPLIVFTYGFTNISNYQGQEATLLGGISYFLFHSGSPAPLNVQILADILVVWVEIGLIYNWAAKAYLLKKHEHASIGSAIVFGFIEGGFEAALLLLSNTISFIRVLVFAIAHYYILYAFSYMAYLAAGNPTSLLSVFINPAGIVILIIGNLLAIALEGLIVFIQDMRLHFYEMFSKFYEGRGRKFEPVMSYIELTQ